MCLRSEKNIHTCTIMHCFIVKESFVCVWLKLIYINCVHRHQGSNQVQADEKKETDGVALSEELQD